MPGQENDLTGPKGLTGYRVVVNPKNKSGPTKELNFSPDSIQAHVSGLMVSHINVFEVSDSAVTLWCFSVQRPLQ